MTPTAPFRTDLNALRALAVGLVVLYHFKFPGFKGGFLGVDVFFVISGYLMTRIIAGDMQQRRFRYLPFVAMRIARIWPALIGLCLVLLAIGAALLPPPDYEDLGRQVRAAVLFYSNEHFKEGIGYFNFGPDERWLLHTWSLSVEWQFYLAYPLVLMAARRWATRNAPVLDTAALHRRLFQSLMVLAVLSFAYGIWAAREDQVSAFFSLFARTWEMLCGGIVYLQEGRFRTLSETARRRVQAAAFAGLLASAIVAGVENWENKWPGGWALVPVLFTMLALACGTHTHVGLYRRMIDHAMVQRLGLWSYSVYLWHWPIMVALNFSEMQPTLAPYMKFLKIGGMLASVVLGYLSYTFVEQRFRYRKERTASQKSVLAPVAAASLVAASAFSVIHTEGWISRAGPDQHLYRAWANLKQTPLMPLACQNSQVEKEQLVSCALHPHTAGRTTLVIGDSHAQHLYAWFTENSATPVDFFTSSGCPPAPGYNRVGPRFFCNEYMDEAMRRAHAPGVGTVVIAGNWSGITSMCRVEKGGCAPNRGQQDVETLAIVQANVEAWHGLAQDGKRVIVVDQSPMSRFNVLTATMRRHFLGLTPLSFFSDLQAGDSPGKRYLDAVFQQIDEAQDVRRISLRPELCGPTDCRITESSSEMPILLDRSHFSPWWIKTHGRALHAALQPPLTAAATTTPSAPALSPRVP